MNVDVLLRKLQPLMPRQVDHWRAVRPLVDDATRELLEREVAATARRVLGDYWNQILLSLPPPKALAGRFQLGTVQYVQPRGTAGLSTAELLQHTAIFGRSGAGKTNVVFSLIQQLSATGVAWLFLDWKRTARELLPLIQGSVNIYTPGRTLAPLAFNPFIVPPGLEAAVYTTQLVDVLADAFTLGDGARSILQKALSACYAKGEAPFLPDVLAAVEAIPGQQRVQAWKISAVRALESLHFARVLPTDAADQVARTKALLNQNTIVELDALAQSAKSFLVPILCLWLYHVQLATRQREKLRIVIVIEEAHHVLYRSEQRRKESAMNTLLRQCRELGIGVIIVDQHPHLISSAALGNAYTTICLNLKDPADLQRAAGILQLETDEKRYLSMLRVGEGICRKQNGHGAFLVRFPLIAVRKGRISDERLAAYLSDTESRSGWKDALARKSGGVSRISGGDEPLEEAALRLLQDVIDHPDSAVRMRYQRLSISVRLGQRIKERLIRQGWLEAALVPIGRTRKLVLRVTPAGREALGLPATVLPQRRESVPHAYWKHYYARRYRERGYNVTVEATCQGCQIDVLAERGNQRIAIEIETGRSHTVTNIRSALRAGCTNVLVVATNENALQRIEKQLALAGLLIPGRVRIALRDREPVDSGLSGGSISGQDAAFRPFPGRLAAYSEAGSGLDTAKRTRTIPEPSSGKNRKESETFSEFSHLDLPPARTPPIHGHDGETPQRAAPPGKYRKGGSQNDERTV